MKKNTTFNLRSSFLEDIKLMIQGNTLSYSTSIEKACSEKQRESKIQLHDSHSGKNRE